MDCRCMELVAVGLYIRKWSRFYRTISDVTSGDFGIPLVVI